MSSGEAVYAGLGVRRGLTQAVFMIFGEVDRKKTESLKFGCDTTE